jgi:hypothetical protein
MRWLVFLLLLLLMLGVLAAEVPAQAAASIDEIRANVTSGDYRTALNKIHKELSASLQDQPQRYELLMLKGECQLQMRDRLGATTAFKSAAKSAANLNELAAARANAVIVERSTMGRYLPRPGARADEAIDILLIDPRKQAMMAVQAELWSQCKQQVDGALRADKLPPIEQVFLRLADAYFLELYASGNASETGNAMQELAAHAFQLMRAEVTKTSSRIDYLMQVANSASDNGRGWNSGRMGLTSPQREEVKAMLPYLNQIRLRATEYRQTAARMGGDERKWDAVVADTVAVISDAESLYNDR